MFDLSKRQLVWYSALIFWVMAFIFSPILPKGDLQWITQILRNMQMVAIFIVIGLLGKR